MMTIDEMIEVLQAAKARQPIQSCPRRIGAADDCDWRNDDNPDWNFAEKEFRVKPKPFEGWVNVYHHW